MDAVSWISGDYWLLAPAPLISTVSLLGFVRMQTGLQGAAVLGGRQLKKEKNREAVCCEVKQRWLISVQIPPPPPPPWGGGCTDGTKVTACPCERGGTGGSSRAHGCRPRPSESCPGRKGRGGGERGGPSPGKVKETSQ